MAPRRKITKVGGNLPFVVQFWVLCCPDLLTTQHSFLFLFLFPLFLPFLLLFSSFLFFSFPPFLFPFPPFLFSLPPPSPCCSPLAMNKSAVAPYIAFKGSMHGMPCVTRIACHVSHMHAFAMHCDTWLAICHPHGSPCVVINMARHVSLDTVASKYLKFRLSWNSTKFDWVARFRKTIPTVQSVLSSEI